MVMWLDFLFFQRKMTCQIHPHRWGVNWQHARGCRIEHEIAIDYDKQVLPYWTIERKYREMLEKEKKSDCCGECKNKSDESENSSCNSGQEA